VLLVIEDLHWADQSTRDLLGFLIHNLRGGVALVLTYRSDELHRRHPLRPFLAELDRSGRVERLELERLGRGDLAELLAGILEEPVAPTLVGEILARSEGNPFFAEELLAAHLEGARLPTVLRDLVLARVEDMSEPAQRVLAVAAVAGTRVDHELLAAVLDQRGAARLAAARGDDAPRPGGRRGQRRLGLPPRAGPGGRLQRPAANPARPDPRLLRPCARPSYRGARRSLAGHSGRARPARLPLVRRA
jgi:predicted ATPase